MLINVKVIPTGRTSLLKKALSHVRVNGQNVKWKPVSQSVLCLNVRDTARRHIWKTQPCQSKEITSSHTWHLLTIPTLGYWHLSLTCLSHTAEHYYTGSAPVIHKRGRTDDLSSYLHNLDGFTMCRLSSLTTPHSSASPPDASRPARHNEWRQRLVLNGALQHNLSLTL